MLFGQTMATQPPGRHTRSISARPASPPWPGAGVRTEHATTRSAKPLGTGRSSKNPGLTRARCPWLGRGQLPLKYLAQPGRGLDSHHLPAPVDEFQRQPPRAGADLDNPVRGARQPADYPGMEPLRGGHPLVKLRLEPVQQFPGQGQVGPRIAAPVRSKAPRLVAGEDPEVRGRVAGAQLPAQAGRVLRGDHRPRPSSCRSPRPGPTAAPPQEARPGAFPRRSPRDFPPSG